MTDTMKDCNAVVIREEGHPGTLATLGLMREPGLVEQIQQGQREPLKDCVEYDPNEEW